LDLLGSENKSVAGSISIVKVALCASDMIRFFANYFVSQQLQVRNSA
jgi:hypothetical protein